MPITNFFRLFIMIYITLKIGRFRLCIGVFSHFKCFEDTVKEKKSEIIGSHMRRKNTVGREQRLGFEREAAETGRDARHSACGVPTSASQYNTRNSVFGLVKCHYRVTGRRKKRQKKTVILPSS